MSQENKKPTHGVYSIRAYKSCNEQRSEWTKLGIAWVHRDGTGFNLKLTYLPLDGELTIYPFVARKGDDTQAPGEGA